MSTPLPNYKDLLLANIPVQMATAKRWMLWKSIPNQDPSKKARKVPVYANGRNRNGKLDTPEDTAQLVTLEQALSVYRPGFQAGLGFALGPDGNGGFWQGLDIDDAALAEQLKDLLPGYVERSPSGVGLHAIGYGKHFPTLGSNKSGVEAYAEARFFTVTGEAV